MLQQGLRCESRGFVAGIPLTSCRAGAPIGSCLVGTKEFIAKARWFRKLFGGGMRQTGFLAGTAAYAVSNNLERLPAVHELARTLEAGLAEIGCDITSPAETCMVSCPACPARCISSVAAGFL